MIMTEFSNIKALLSAMEKLMDLHPELEVELQSIFQKEIVVVRRENLERLFS
jgi:DNA-directed RNA polymerase subunit F